MQKKEKKKKKKANQDVKSMTNSMEQSPFWEANRTSATQEIPRILWNPIVHYRFYHKPPPVPVLIKIDSVHDPQFTSLRYILLLSSHLRLYFNLSSGFLTKILYATLFSPYLLYVTPISVFLIWAPDWYLVKSTEHNAPLYVVFSTPLLTSPTLAQIKSSASYSRRP